MSDDLVEQVAERVRIEHDAVLEVGDPLEVHRADPADHADHLVALVEEQLGEVAAVLAGDAGDEGSVGHREVLTCAGPGVCQVGWHDAREPGAADRELHGRARAGPSRTRRPPRRLARRGVAPRGGHVGAQRAHRRAARRAVQGRAPRARRRHRLPDRQGRAAAVDGDAPHRGRAAAGAAARATSPGLERAAATGRAAEVAGPVAPAASPSWRKATPTELRGRTPSPPARALAAPDDAAR